MYRIFTLVLLLGLMLCSHTPAFAAGMANQQSMKQAAAVPQLSILSPKNGTNVTGTTVIVQVLLLNFKPVPSKVPSSELGQHPEANQPNEGHIRLLLDVEPVVIIDQGTSYTFMNVARGPHTLRVYLVNNDDSALDPSVERQVEFTIGTLAARNSAPVNPPAQRLPRTAGPESLLSSDLVIIWLLVISMAILIGGLATQSYSQVAIFNAKVNANIETIQRIAAAHRRANTEKPLEPK